MKNNILVVVAHPDDEILGVGGTILKHVDNNDIVNILILGDGETSRSGGVDVQKRKKQARTVANKLGAASVVIDKFSDNRFDSISLLDIVKAVERLVNRLKPNIIYTHHDKDLNVDHRLTSQAVMTVCRPQPDFFVKEIFTFETLSSTEWQIKGSYNCFCPTMYNDISRHVEKKFEILKIYKDELREYPHPRSLEGVKILSQYRGIEVGYKYAEAFQVIRLLR